MPTTLEEVEENFLTRRDVGRFYSRDLQAFRPWPSCVAFWNHEVGQRLG